MSMRINDFKAVMPGGGARPNLFKVSGGFPNNATTGLSGVLGAVGGAAVGAASGDILGAANSLLGGSGPGRNLEFLCKGAQIPAGSLGMITVPYRGRQLKVPGNRTFADWTITILNDGQYSIRNAFEEWSNKINSHDGNVGPGSIEEIFQTWTVEQLDQSGNTIKTYEFQGVWPMEVGAIDLSADANDTIEEYSVTLAYQYWTSNTTS